jgi:cell wall-associated NlpC family hydrolase
MQSLRRALPSAILAGAIVLTAAAPAAAKVSFGDRTLREGMAGHDVRVLQDKLTESGLRTAVDGNFGPGTTRRVRSFERHHSLRVNGIVSGRDAAVIRQAARSAAGAQPKEAEPAPTGKATIRNGLAVAPADAPAKVQAIIDAGNEIAKKPYKYGGGHGRWNDSGYDCSGSMSYAFHGAGMLDTALDSSGFMRWGSSGRGQWVTNYANSGHSYMVVAGLRFDTSGLSQDGTRWHRDMRSSSGYTVRHPAGL